MEPLALWEQILIGVFGVLLLLWCWPRARALLRESAEAEKDWPALLLPMGAVVAFVVILILLV